MNTSRGVFQRRALTRCARLRAGVEFLILTVSARNIRIDLCDDDHSAEYFSLIPRNPLFYIFHNDCETWRSTGGITTFSRPECSPSKPPRQALSYQQVVLCFRYRKFV